MNNIIPVSALVAALESDTSGNAVEELEYVYYGKLTDLAELQRIAAGREHQKQFSIMKANGSIRVRAVDDQRFELTSKVWKTGVNGKEEVTNPTSRDQFDHFMIIGDSGMEKTRYDVIIPGTEGTWKPTDKNPTPKYNGSLFWEFDVFVMADGTTPPWIKVDLEVPEFTRTEFPLPPLLTDVLDAQFGNRTEEQEAFIKSLYRDYFTIKISA